MKHKINEVHIGRHFLSAKDDWSLTKDDALAFIQLLSVLGVDAEYSCSSAPTTVPDDVMLEAVSLFFYQSWK